MGHSSPEMEEKILSGEVEMEMRECLMKERKIRCGESD